MADPSVSPDATRQTPEQLIAKWREVHMARMQSHVGDAAWNAGNGLAFRDCADELEAALRASGAPQTPEKAKAVLVVKKLGTAFYGQCWRLDAGCEDHRPSCREREPDKPMNWCGNCAFEELALAFGEAQAGPSSASPSAPPEEKEK